MSKLMKCKCGCCWLPFQPARVKVPYSTGVAGRGQAGQAARGFCLWPAGTLCQSGSLLPYSPASLPGVWS